MMDEKKIMIINLSKGRVGEGNANLIGSMLITKIYLAAMSRADKNENELAKLPPFYLYVDEFQSFANKTFADILSEARKYKLSLNIAHQYIEQMEEEVRDAVFGNVGTMISFRVGAFDAEVLEKEFAPTFEAADLVNLGFAQIYLKLMIDSVSSQPFSAKTLPGVPKPEKIFKDEVVGSSRAQFARPRADVEKTIADWHDVGGGKDVRKDSNQQNQYSQQNQSGENRNRRPFEENRPQPVQNMQPPKIESKVDENKIAFMKVAEELKSRMPEKVEEKKPETVSLSALVKDKKNPSKENMSSLKDALASVISKPKVEEKKEEKREEKVAEKNNIQKNESSQTPKVESKHVSAREVPEEVLRELLNMDSSK
jgi:hypothetical protein